MPVQSGRTVMDSCRLMEWGASIIRHAVHLGPRRDERLGHGRGIPLPTAVQTLQVVQDLCMNGR